MINADKTQKIAFTLICLAAILTFVTLFSILYYVISRGWAMLSLDFLLQEPSKMGSEGGIYPAIVGTLYLVGLTILIATPMGVGTAIFLNEYTLEGPGKKVIRFAIDALAGIPSIVFGLFGFAFFVIILKPITGGWSLLSGALTGVIMVLPIIIRSSEEALKNVPNTIRESSLALGATKWYTVKKIVLPTALPGILTSIILSIGRIVGETAAFLLTLGGSLLIPTSLFDSGRTLSLHLYLVAMETGNMDMAFGTGVVLIFLVLLINFTVSFLLKKMMTTPT